MGGMMDGRQILPSTGVVGPVGNAGCCEVEASGNLASVCVPCGIDVGRPDDRAVALHSEIGIAREYERAFRGFIFAKAFIERLGMKQRVNVVVLGTGADVVV